MRQSLLHACCTLDNGRIELALGPKTVAPGELKAILPANLECVAAASTPEYVSLFSAGDKAVATTASRDELHAMINSRLARKD